MRTIIAGSRDITEPAIVSRAMAQAALRGIVPTIVLCGCARGVDTLGRDWAEDRDIPVHLHPAEWTRDGRFDPGAGYRRNVQMARHAEALVAIWNGKSRGTLHMIRTAREKGMLVHVYLTTEPKKENTNAGTQDS